MSTTTMVPAVIDKLLADAGASMHGSLAAVKVSQTWPGPDASREMFFLGKTTWEDYRLKCIKAGRKLRDETAKTEFEVWVLGAEGTTPANPGPTRDRAFAILAKIEDILANDPRIGLGSAVLWVELEPNEAEPRELANGWAYRINGTINTHARLT